MVLKSIEKEAMKKRCEKCGKTKPLEAFVKNATCTDGRAGTCRACGNAYCTAWKRKNAKRISSARRKRYAETDGMEVKAREQRRRERAPLRVQCQRLRGGMVERSRLRGLPFDSDTLTVNYLMERIEAKPTCECCGVAFKIGGERNGVKCNASPSIDRIRPQAGYTVKNIALLCWRCNNLKRDATPQELKAVMDWLWTVWGNEVEANALNKLRGKSLVAN
jgi:hypothetical protein